MSCLVNKNECLSGLWGDDFLLVKGFSHLQNLFREAKVIGGEREATDCRLEWRGRCFNSGNTPPWLLLRLFTRARWTRRAEGDHQRSGMLRWNLASPKGNCSVLEAIHFICTFGMQAEQADDIHCLALSETKKMMMKKKQKKSCFSTSEMLI